MTTEIAEMFKEYPDIVTVKDIYGGMLPISRKLAYDLLSSGAIEHIRVGKKILIPKRCVIAYMERLLLPAN
jgi:excisionase family DNA binding protein